MFLIRRKITAAVLLSLALLSAAGTAEEAPRRVVLLRVPDRGIQPQAAVDADGAVHLLYFKDEPAAGDVFYVRSRDGADFGRPVRVNSQPGSAIAVGNIRGAHLALGKNGRPHVAWNGSGKALPKAPGDATPMLYTRLDDAGKAFEPQRNVIHTATGLNGGGSVAADSAGQVYVVWHATDTPNKDEANRRVWLAVSSDEGKTFAPEKAAWAERTGACGCCGLRAFADGKGTVYALYRGVVKEGRQRDMYLLTSADRGKSFRGEDVHPWAIDSCPMSSEAFAEGPEGLLVAAWDTRGQVYLARIDAKTGKRSAPVAAPGEGKDRKHPAVAVNAKGEMILAWTEGMGWERGGSVAWQVYGPDGTATEERGRAEGVPVWSLVAAFVRPDGRFAVVY
jgi:hypothetical protein